MVAVGLIVEATGLDRCELCEEFDNAVAAEGPGVPGFDLPGRMLLNLSLFLCDDGVVADMVLQTGNIREGKTAGSLAVREVSNTYLSKAIPLSHNVCMHVGHKSTAVQSLLRRASHRMAQPRILLQGFIDVAATPGIGHR